MKEKIIIHVILSLCSCSFAYARNDVVAEVGDTGQWGNPGAWEYCPEGSYAGGYSMKVEPDQGGGNNDDTAVNGIKLYCVSRQTSDVVSKITSNEGEWGGDYREGASCSNSEFLKSFLMKSEPYRGSGQNDDTATTSVRFKCTDGREIQASGTMPWGKWKSYITCPDKEISGKQVETVICGIQTWIEPKKGSGVSGGDDTALNGAMFACCALQRE